VTCFKKSSLSDESWVIGLDCPTYIKSTPMEGRAPLIPQLQSVWGLFWDKCRWFRDIPKILIVLFPCEISAEARSPPRPKSLIKLTMVAAGRNGPHREWFIQNWRIGSLGIHPRASGYAFCRKWGYLWLSKCPVIAAMMQPCIGAIIGCLESHNEWFIRCRHVESL